MSNTAESRSSKRPDLKALSKDIVWEEAGSGQGTDAEKKSGFEIIGEFVKRLPGAPGVYRMLNSAGDVLYVGKARNLKNRVTSYSRATGHTNRIARMISDTASMEFITTHTEIEALLLEANLVKRLRPRYNVLLRDDKTFPYILVSGDHEASGLFKHRGARSRKGKYFGPFASAGAVNDTISTLQKVFLLRTCTDSFYQGRTRPCLQHQIKRCAAPCTGEISLEDYAKLVQEAHDFLSGKSQKIKNHLAENMQAASERMDFEQAAIYRDRLGSLSHVQSHQGINPRHVDEADIFALHQQGGQSCIQVFFFRTGQNWGNRAYFPRADKSFEPEEILGAFLGQFYDDKPVPKLVLISHEIEDQQLLQEALSIRANRKVKISRPIRGEKRELVAHVQTNAREALGRRLAETASHEKLMAGMAEAFDLDEPPKRVEVYDNSHIMGTNAVGAMIVAGPEGFVKNQYRKFNMKSKDLVPGDDYGMMQEVMTRRFSRLIKERGPKIEHVDTDDGSLVPWPDLVLIDGGLGQLNAVREVMKELELLDVVPLVGIAKGPDRNAGRERFFIHGRTPFSLPMRDPVLYHIQRLRDEAHRFAIGSHRARRKKEMIKNPLDEISGIGPTRKRAILHHFGSAKATSRAGIEDLKTVEGVSAHMAQVIYDFFHESGEK
jgi:excinuclease ABC subunit C